ncbi:tetratricopeptide repeat protein [Haemophilus haemolyticus]|uniref:tetratricopeptide repeat protein n=1 Tax=Haemophilus haemolyticus TaxID=726 RepID=UPI000E578F6C|nr:tetratricopeptide repeat protein [Haemophilus haemolyticus]
MKLTKTLLTSALLATSIFSVQSTAWADMPEQQFQQAVESYDKRDYQTAFKLWLPLAEQGLAEAQSNLGLMYEFGQGIKQDNAEAVKWFRKAAEQGYSMAQFNLGVNYYKGEGVKRNPSKAKEWFRKACENGYQKACDVLR